MALKLITGPLGPLTVRVVDEDARVGPPDVAVVLCHGFGAPGTDLVSIAREVMMVRPALLGRARFVFPEAPHELPGGGGGRMWWPIDMARIQRAMMSGDADAEWAKSAGETPVGLPEARKALKASLEALLAQTKLPMGKVVVGGFSQGAMLATDVALRLDEAPAGLAILSGALVSKDDWQRLAPKRAGLRVLQSHGKDDPILPFGGAVRLQELLVDAGLRVGFVPFDGGHGIDGDVIEALAALIETAAQQP